MRKTSNGNLFNLSNVSRVLKHAAYISWEVDTSGYDLLSDGHFVIRLTLHSDDPVAAFLHTIFERRPYREERLFASRKGRTWEVSEGASLHLQEWMDRDYLYDVCDTLLSYHRDYDDMLHVYECNGTYIQIQDQFYNMLFVSPVIRAEKEAKSSPVAFYGSCDERAVILPVVYFGDVPCPYLCRFETWSSKTA